MRPENRTDLLNEPSTETIALVSCVKQKRGRSSPACDLYTSPLFVKMRAVAERFADRWFILSAKYGLLRPDVVVDSYEQTLNDALAAERKAWAERVFEEMNEAGIVRSGASFIWLAGARYKDSLSRMLHGLPQHDPMAGMRIGHRLSWLNSVLRGDIEWRPFIDDRTSDA